MFWIKDKRKKIYHRYNDIDDCLSVCHLQQKPWAYYSVFWKLNKSNPGKKCKHCLNKYAKKEV